METTKDKLVMVMAFDINKTHVFSGDSELTCWPQRIHVDEDDHTAEIRDIGDWDDNQFAGLRHSSITIYTWPSTSIHHQGEFNSNIKFEYENVRIERESQASAIAKMFRKINAGLERIHNAEGSTQDVVEMLVRYCRVMKITDFYMRRLGDTGSKLSSYTQIPLADARDRITSWLANTKANYVI